MGEAGVDASDVTITKVTSDEAEDAPGGGDGQATRDIATADDRPVQLRAERQGSGNERVYTIRVQVSDRLGNSATKSFQVRVPRAVRVPVVAVHQDDTRPRS